jgi:hypothetical protein
MLGVSDQAPRRIFGGLEKKKKKEKKKEKKKRDSSAAPADSFAGANKKKKRRPASVGMTVGRSCCDKKWGRFLCPVLGKRE